jgi:hypothetical protein
VDDAHERHADAVADRVVAGESAEALLDTYASGTSPTCAESPVQQKIFPKKAAAIELPTTWLALSKLKMHPALQAATEARAEIQTRVAQRLVETHGTMDHRRLDKAWGKVARSHRVHDLLEGREALVDAVVKSYFASATSSVSAAKREGEASQIADLLKAKDPNLEFVGGARNPTVQRTPMATFGTITAVTPEEKAKRIQTYLAGILLSHTNREGEEIQTSLPKNGGDLIVSSNLNAVNAMLAKVQTKNDLRELARNVVLAADPTGALTRADAMSNRLTRHALKLFDRIDLYLAGDGTVKNVVVPARVSGKEDGLHAEVRIYRDPAFRADQHHLPSGTKIPCAMCHLTFVEANEDIGTPMGKFWMTGAALMPVLKGQKMGSLRAALPAIGTALANLYQQAVAKNGKMGRTQSRGGDLTDDHGPDSGSDMDEPKFQAVMKLIRATFTASVTPPPVSAAGGRPPDRPANMPLTTSTQMEPHKRSAGAHRPRRLPMSAASESVMDAGGASSQTSSTSGPAHKWSRARGDASVADARLEEDPDDLQVSREAADDDTLPSDP